MLCKCYSQTTWHNQPWDRRGTIYQQHAAFTTALVTAYGGPFTQSNGWPDIRKQLSATYSGQELVLHEKLIELRHTVYALQMATTIRYGLGTPRTSQRIL